MGRTRHLGILAFALAVTSLGPAGAQSNAPQAPDASAGITLTVPAGQKFILQLETSIHTNSTRTGDRVEFKTAADIFADNLLIVPGQSRVRATVTKARRAGRLAGRAEVQLRLDEICLAGGTTLPLRATIVRVGYDPVNETKDGQPRIKGEAGTGGSIKAVAVAGAQGAMIGVLAAGAKGAMYGGGAAAAITLAGIVLQRGPDLDLPRNTMFEARFDKPLTVPQDAAQRAILSARNQPPDMQIETASPNDPTLPSRPVLRRKERVEQPPAENPAAPPTIESAGNPQPEEPASIQPPRVAEAPPLEPPPPPRPAPEASGTPNPGGFTLSVNVKMVLVDAVVRDRAGRMIDNLNREDFRVFEDGVEQQIRNFSRDQLPLAVALVVDRSGSVAPYISELRRVANRALQQLKQGDQVALFSFANTVERLEDLTTDRRRIADGLSRIHAGGSTDIIDALFDATTYLADVAPDHRRAIILVSDNQPTVRPQVSEGQAIRTAMETETVIYSLRTSGTGTPLSMRLPNLMVSAGSVRKIALETGGEVIDVSGVHALDAALGGIMSRLRMRYALGYYPPGQGRNTSFHSIEVRLADRLGQPGKDYYMHARRGYYPTAEPSAAQSRP